jgi:chemotaxis protein MotB
MGEEQEVNTSMWMMTFSDLVMLLLTFFVLLLTMSSMDKKKLDDLFTQFNEATGVLEFSGYHEIKDIAKFINEYSSSDSLVMIDHNELLKMVLPSVELKSNLEEMMEDPIEAVQIKDDERGIVLSLHEDILFDQGKATLKKEIYPMLDRIAVAIDDTSNDIYIAGHTDNLPIHSELYPSNWELSAYRGLDVLSYFLTKKGLPPSRFSVGGYGASRPLKPNSSKENRAINRRVEIIFKHLEDA